ncbi:conserved domain protein [Peptoniphilus sp. oral taxon 375 str. F0436]|nr:conserved domain protein [Peptoniphilus sp. oral taxon 375 str. F0436]
MDIKQIASEKKEDQVELYVTNSTTISGLDEDGICENIEEAGHRVNYIKGDFLDYYRGTSTYLTKLAKSVKNYRMDNQGKTLVFGLNKNTFGSFQAFEDSLKFIEDTNEFSLFQKNEREGIKNIWCPSIEGYTGAKNLGDRLNVPIYLGLPLGVNQTKEFFQMLGLKERSASSSHNDHSKENLSIKNVAILLDPWQGWKLSLFLKERGINSSIYTYAPEKELEEFFKASPHGEHIKYFSSGEDLKDIGSRHSYFIGDPLFLTGLKKKQRIKFIPYLFHSHPLVATCTVRRIAHFIFTTGIAILKMPG